MSNFIAPGVYVQERDFSDYIASEGTTSLGLVGTAKRGPINEPTFCSSTEFFLETFGEPSINHYGPYAALDYLKAGNQLWYVRVAKEFEEDVATLDTLGAADGDGNIFIINVGAGEGASFTTNDYVRIRQTGKATTLAKIASISTDELTLETKILDTYDPSSGADTTIDLSATDLGATNSEVFGYTRTGGAATRLTHFKARHVGDWADFGTRQGIEIVIEDGGQYTNVDPVTNEVIEDIEGNPLQGVIPSVPSKDTVGELLALTEADDVLVNELRGVNYSSAVARVTNAVGDGGDVVLTVDSSANFTVGDDIVLSGFLTSTDFNGTHAVTAVPDATSIEIADPTAGETETPSADVVIAVNADSDHKGLVYRCTAVRTTGSDWEAAGVLTKRLKVLYQGRQVELFDSIIGYDANSELFWDAVIGTAEAPKSEYITAEYLGNGEQPVNSYNRVKHPNNPRLLMGSSTAVKVSDDVGAGVSIFENANGVNGDNPASADFIGVIKESGARTGLQLFRLQDKYDVDLIACPANAAASIINELIAVASYRNDCLALIDPPYGLNAQEVTSWHNGTGEWTGQHAPFTASQAAIYYPWVKKYDPYTSRDVWLPPSCVVPSVYATSDRLENVWTAPAGIKRGKILNAIDTELTIEEGDVEFFYGPASGNAINPIRNFARDGICVYGNRTAQRFPSALDRIDVRRLVFHIEKAVASTTRTLNFNKNTEILWGEWLALVNPFLQNLQGQEALEWFQAVCDETTNTPTRRNNNETYAKIYIIPTKTSEKIIIDLALFASGARVQEIIAQDIDANL